MAAPNCDVPFTSGDENLSQPPALLRIFLWFALAWGLLLVLLSFVMPVVTVWSGHDGPRPRVSVVHAYGLIGILPAMGILAAAALTAWLLALGRYAPSRASLTLAEGIAGVVFVVGLLAPVVFHLSGPLVLSLSIS